MNSIIKWSCLSVMIALSPALVAGRAYAEDVNRVSEQSEFSEAEMAQLLAPIALYPDSLLTHILIASTYPLEVVQAQRWLDEHPGLSTDQLMKLAEQQDWDPSVKALLAFPNVLKQMSDDLDWTRKLGDAFLQDEAKLLASIQTLRQQADEANSLAEMDNVKIKRVNRQIIIEPLQPEVIYVPYYDPWIVYGQWRWIGFPPFYWDVYPYYTRHGHFYWHTGIHIGFNFFFSAFNWHTHHLVVSQPRHSHHYRSHNVIVHSRDARHWQHQPHHRRGVAYRNDRLRHKYHGNRPNAVSYSRQVQTLKGINNFPAHQSSNRLQQPRDKVFIDKLRGNDYRSKVRGDSHKGSHKGSHSKPAHGQQGLPRTHSNAMPTKTPTWKHDQAAKFKRHQDVTTSRQTSVKPRDWGNRVNKGSAVRPSSRVDKANNNGHSYNYHSNKSHGQAKPPMRQSPPARKHHSSDSRRMEQRK